MFICGLILLFSANIFPQKIAILTPELTAESKTFAEDFESSLSEKFSTLDLSLAESVLKAKAFENPFNLSIEDAKNLGVTIGCNFFIIIKTDILRRTKFERDKYFEAYATYFLVSSRTGRLVFWTHKMFEEDTPEEARKKLFNSIKPAVNEITDQITATNKKELSETDSGVNEFPDADSPLAKDLRPPLPYRRIKPKYTSLASLYSVAATVDVLVDVDEKGEIVRTEIVRWAGYGLGESVIETVKSMNWRPADRKGKTLPMRILLRYNFRDIETDD